MNITLKCMYSFLILSRLLTLLTDKKTIQTLQELRIPNKLVRLIKMALQNTEASVKIESLTSEPFSISSGVRQGNPLSATIFNLTLDSVIKKQS